MTEEIRNNKRIAKNAILLYIRMVFVIAISLYTSRVILAALGIDDYGIYNVVGGVVSLFGFLNVAMSSTTQRFITFSLASKDGSEPRTVFSTCLVTHFIIAFVVLVIAETIGLWFLNNKLIISADRLSTAFWVFQCSVVSTVVLIMRVPFNAEIIAHEKMSAFAYISILEVCLKLLIAFLISTSNFDRLLVYAALLLCSQILISFIYILYCFRHFLEVGFRFFFERNLFKEMLSFTSWNLWGGLSQALYTQGVNILLNLFFGTALNAARGVAVQVQGVVSQFANNFLTAVTPQITKTYAVGEKEQMQKLVFCSSRYTFLLLFVLAFPIFMEINFLLSLWLKNAPEWAGSFVKIMLCIVIVDSMANPFMHSVAATGKIKFYQSVIGGTMLLIVPVSYVVLKTGASPASVFAVHFSFCVITFVIRLFIVKSMLGFKIRNYVIGDLLRCICAAIPVAFLSIWIKNFDLPPLLVIFISVFFAFSFCFAIGLNQFERNFLVKKIKAIVGRIL